jgi:hypothetical protein
MVKVKYAPLVKLMHRDTESGEFMQVRDMNDSCGLESNGTSLYGIGECSSFFSHIYKLFCSLESKLAFKLRWWNNSTEQAKLGI